MSPYYLISLVYLASALVLFLIAGIILKENARSNQNRVVSAMLLFAGIAPFFSAIYRTVIIEPADLSQPITNIFYIWELFFPILLWFSVLFPEPLPFYRRHKRLLQLAFVPHIFRIFMAIFFNNPERLADLFTLDTSLPVIGFALNIVGSLLKLIAALLGLILSFHTRFFSLINLTYVLGSIYFLASGYGNINNPALKIQVKIVIAGVGVAVGLYALSVIIPTMLSLQFPEVLREIMILTALIVGPGSIAWAIIKYRFLDMGVIARQSLVYTITTAIVVGGYLLIINQLSTLFFATFGFQSRILDILIVVIMLLFFQPIYTQVDDFVRRLFIRSRSDYRHLMESVSRELITVFDTSRLVTLVSDLLNREMFIERTHFALRQDKKPIYKLVGESREYPIEDGLLAILLEKQKPIFMDSVKRLARNGHLLNRLASLNGHLLLPLADKGELVGLISTSPKIAGFRYTYEDITLLTVLANQVVVAINNAKLYAESLEKQRLEEELAMARQIQINLLPSRVPEHEKYEFAAFNHPSRQVGGDYYDFITTAGGQTSIVIADVAGKGVGAALLMARLQAILQSEGRRGSPMETMIAGINEFLFESTSPEQFITMFYGELDCDKGDLCFCNAGHNYPFILRRNSDVVLLKDGGLLLGAITGAAYQKAQVQLASGDILVVYTDGLSEAFSEAGEEFGEDRLIRTVHEARGQSAQFICGHLIKTVRQFASDTVESDDMTLIVVKVK